MTTGNPYDDCRRKPYISEVTLYEHAGRRTYNDYELQKGRWLSAYYLFITRTATRAPARTHNGYRLTGNFARICPVLILDASRAVSGFNLSRETAKRRRWKGETARAGRRKREGRAVLSGKLAPLFSVRWFHFLVGLCIRGSRLTKRIRSRSRRVKRTRRGNEITWAAITRPLSRCAVAPRRAARRWLSCSASLPGG